MLKRARASGIPNFHIFGEVAAEGVDVAQLARHTRVDKLPSVLDFGFAGALQKCWPAMRAPRCSRGSTRTMGCTKAGARGAAPADLHRQPRLRPLRMAGAQARPQASDDESPASA
jgi:hypothetical protein